MHVIAAKAVAFGEALRRSSRAYAQQVVVNAAALADALSAGGLPPGLRRHRQPPDAGRPAPATRTSPARRPRRRSTRPASPCNKNTIPDDPRSPFVTSGVRLGTPAVTTAGMGADEMRVVADLIVRTLKARTDEGEIADVRADVAALCAAFPPYRDLVG